MRKGVCLPTLIRELAAEIEPPTWTEGHGLVLVDGG